MRTRNVSSVVMFGVAALCLANQGSDTTQGPNTQSEVNGITHSRRDLKTMQENARIHAAFEDARKRGDFATAEDILVNQIMRREPAGSSYQLWASQLYFEMGRTRDASRALQLYLAKHDTSRNNAAGLADLQCYQELLRRSQEGKYPAWRDFKVKGEVFRASDELVRACESAIGAGYFRTAKLILAEMKRAGTDGETYNLIKDRLAKAQKERADAQPKP